MSRKNGQQVALNQNGSTNVPATNIYDGYANANTTPAAVKVQTKHDIVYNGVKYQVDDETNEATVKGLEDEKFTGAVVIEPTIKYNGKDYPVTTIGKEAFYYSTMSGITLPETLTTIDEYAFEHAYKMKKLIIPDSVQKIGTMAFSGMSSLNHIYMPESLKRVGSSIFNDIFAVEIHFKSMDPIERMGGLYDITSGARNYLVYVNDKIYKNQGFELDGDKGTVAKVPLAVTQDYGTFYWKNGNLVNKNGKVIIPAKKYDKVDFRGAAIIVKKGSKYGAVTYSGTQIVAPVYDEFLTSGREGRLLFTNKTPNGVKGFIFSQKGALLTSRAFTNSQRYSIEVWLKDWM